MSEPSRPAGGDLDEAEMLNDGEFDIEDFIDSMEDTSDRRVERSPARRAGWQRIDEWRDARRLRDQLNDWDDWRDEPDEV